MNLFEEYCRRHGLRCPVIKRPDNRLYVLYRADPARWKASWMVFQISTRQESYHPSYYQFSWLRPNHNGAFNSRFLDDISDPQRVEWDDYDIEIIKSAQRNDGLVPIINLSDAKMAAWEMFLYCADDHIGGLPFSIRVKVFRSLDPDLSIEDRMGALADVQDHIKLYATNIYSRWKKMEQYYLPGGYATWYAELVDRMRDNTYRQDFGDLQSVA